MIKIKIDLIRCNIINMSSHDFIPYLRNKMKTENVGWHFSKGKLPKYKYHITPIGSFKTGLLPIVLHFCKLGKIKIVDYTDERNPVNQSTFENGIVDTYKGYSLRDYQKEDLSKCIRFLTICGDKIPFHRGVITTATNRGKTYSSMLFHKSIKDCKMIFITNNVMNFNEYVHDFKNFFDSVGVVSSKKVDVVGHEIIVCMIKTLINRFKTYPKVRNICAKCNTLIVDEGHDFLSTKNLAFFDKIKADIRFTLTGSFDNIRKEQSKVNLFSVFSNVVVKATKKENSDLGISLSPKILIRRNREFFDYGKNYNKERSELIFKSTERLKLILVDVERFKDRFILISFIDIQNEQGKSIHAALRLLGYKCSYIDGSTKKSVREKELNRFKSGDINILVASTILKQGLNINNIEVIIYVSGGKDKIFLDQIMGRGERLYLNNDIGKACKKRSGDNFLFIDYYDNGRYVKKHSKARLSYYATLDFPIFIDFDPREIGRVRFKDKLKRLN